MDIGVTVGDSVERIGRTGSGFSRIEFGLSEAAEIPVEIDNRELQRQLQHVDAGLDVHLPFKQVVATPVSEINKAIVGYLSRLLRWAGDMNAQKAVLHGTARDPYDTDQRSFVAKQLEQIVAAGAAHNVEVVVENVGHQRHGLQLSVLGDIARSTDTPICFDIGHAFMEEGQGGIDRFLKRNGDLISHLHVHDVRSRGDTHMPVGAGEIDFSSLATHLDGFAGSVAIEVFTDDTDLLHDSADRIASLLPDQ